MSVDSTKVVTAPATVVAPPEANQPKVGDLNTAPTTTAAEDRTKDGQRVVNLMWETTQRAIALIVVITAIGVACFKSILDAINAKEPAVAGPAFIFLVAAANLVVGFYFGRTNHERQGGVGVKTDGSR